MYHRRNLGTVPAGIYHLWRVNTSPELCSYRKGPTPILHQTMFRFATGEPPNTITTQARGKRTSASQRWEAGGRARASCQSRLLRPVVTNWGGRRRTMPSSARRLSRTVRESLRRARAAAPLGFGVRASWRGSDQNGGLAGCPHVSRGAGKGVCGARVMGTIALGLACGPSWDGGCMPVPRALWR